MRAGALAAAGLTGFLLVGAVIAIRRGPPPSPAAAALPPLSPRGETLRGVEVFAPGYRSNEEIVELCYAVHEAVSSSLGSESSPTGLRLHMFSGPSVAEAYVKQATGRHQRGTSYVRLGDQRLVVLEPASDWRLLLHEISHDATCQVLGEDLPAWFGEGLAVSFESWFLTGGRLFQRPNVTWATRFLEHHEANELPAHEVLSGGLRFNGSASYARAWASYEALRFLARWGGRLSPATPAPAAALDQLGLSLAEAWGRPRRWVTAWSGRARAAQDQAERLRFLALASAAETRLHPPDLDPSETNLELAEVLRELGEDPVAERASAVLVRLRGQQADWVHLARSALQRGWRRVARHAARKGQERHGPTELLTRLQGEDPPPRGLVEARAGKIELSSKTWDAGPLRELAQSCERALERVQAMGWELIHDPRLKVELPGAGAADVIGWPADPALARVLVARLRACFAPPKALRWQLVGAVEAMSWELDPARGQRSRARLRGALAAHPSLIWQDARDRFTPSVPALRAAAALDVTANVPLEESIERSSLQPSDYALVATDLGRRSALEVALQGQLNPLERWWIVFRSLELGGDDLSAATRSLEKRGREAAARCLAEVSRR